jgi:hypothetical protein
MDDVTLVGIDLGKHSFHLHGQNAKGKTIVLAHRMENRLQSRVERSRIALVCIDRRGLQLRLGCTR